MALVRVKICCIANAAEARMAVDYGASALGLVSAMPSGPGVIPDGVIAEIARFAPPAVATVLLTSLTSVSEIIDQQRRCAVNAIQICDDLEDGTHSDLRVALPGISLLQVVHVTGPESVEKALTMSKHVHGILLDSGNQDLLIKELGGTGRTHDWELSRQIVKGCSVPVFLAGGLTPENVLEAVGIVGPYGVDICSGVRTGGCLDEGKLARFMENVTSFNAGRQSFGNSG